MEENQYFYNIMMLTFLGLGVVVLACYCITDDTKKYYQNKIDELSKELEKVKKKNNA